jgi:hypothetical protein
MTHQPQTDKPAEDNGEWELRNKLFIAIDTNSYTTAIVDKIMHLIHQHTAVAVREARIDELKNALNKYSRTYQQKVTDPSGEVYVDDSHGYISRYEVQERIAALQHEGKGGGDARSN